jgi:hypothetical protein
VGEERGMSNLNWPLDCFLALLDAGELPWRGDDKDHRIWWSMCPHCLGGEWDLRIAEPCRGGPISLWCKSRSRCTEQEILAAVKERPALVVAQEREQVALERHPDPQASQRPSGRGRGSAATDARQAAPQAGRLG